MFGYSGSGHPGYSEMSVQSPGAHAQLPSIPSLFSHLHSHGSPGPGPATPDTDPYYHQTQGPSVTGFPGYQTQLKRPKKKPRSPKMGPDGIPCKRKSREGTTTYLWEFLLKLLQVWQLTLHLYITWLDIPRTKTAARSSSSGPTGRRASSSWWTARRCPGCGASTRTSRTWTTRRWAEPWGKYPPSDTENKAQFPCCLVMMCTRASWNQCNANVLKCTQTEKNSFVTHTTHTSCSGITTREASWPRWTARDLFTSLWTFPRSVTSLRLSAMGPKQRRMVANTQHNYKPTILLTQSQTDSWEKLLQQTKTGIRI